MNKRLLWLALGTFAIGAEGFVISSLLPQIADDTGVTVIEAGYLVLAYALAYAIGSPVLTALTGTRDRRVVLTASALVFAGGAIVVTFTHTYAVLMAARIVIACAAGLYAATAQATAVAMSHSDHRARAISHHRWRNFPCGRTRRTAWGVHRILCRLEGHRTWR